MVIIFNICLAFAGMSAKDILGHCSGCKMKHNNEEAKCEGQEKAHKSQKKKKSKS